jgi:hypothetical protein
LVLGSVALALLALVGGPAAAWAADGEDGALLPAWFPAVESGMKDLPPFFRDTQLTLQLRSCYRNNEASPDTYQEAWATGGWLGYKSGWLADTFAIGATGYLSLPFYAPDDRDGTLLLQPGQNTIAVVGEAWAKLRYWEQVLTGGRQLINVDYVNPQDNRMIPNTFEALLLSGKLGWLGYTAGYVFTIKPREENVFQTMAERAGAANASQGLALVGFQANPWKPLALNLSTAFGVDTFNTVFFQAEYTRPLAKDVVLTVGGQYHLDFDRADETAWGVKVTYDFARLGVPGLTAFFWYAQGTGADNTSSGGAAPDRREYDFT